LYALFLRRPVVPPGVPPLSEVPLLEPDKSAELLSHGIATTTTLSETSVAVADTKRATLPSRPSPSPPEATEKPKSVVQTPPKAKPKSSGKVVRASKSAKPSPAKRKVHPAKTSVPTKQTSPRRESPRERVPSAFEQLMRSRAERARTKGVSVVDDPVSLDTQREIYEHLSWTRT